MQDEQTSRNSSSSYDAFLKLGVPALQTEMFEAAYLVMLRRPGRASGMFGEALRSYFIAMAGKSASYLVMVTVPR